MKICSVAKSSMLTFLETICRGFMEIDKFTIDLIQGISKALKYFYLNILLHVRNSSKFKNPLCKNPHKNKDLSGLSFCFKACNS